MSTMRALFLGVTAALLVGVLILAPPLQAAGGVTHLPLIAADARAASEAAARPAGNHEPLLGVNGDETCAPERAYVISGRVFFDKNANGAYDDADVGTKGDLVRLHRDADADGLVGEGDLLLATQVTAEGGQYLIATCETLPLVLDVDARTLPRGHRFSTQPMRAIWFRALGETAAGIDFGHLPQPFAENQLLVAFAPHTPQSVVDKLLLGQGLKIREHIPALNVYLIWTPPGRTDEIYQWLRSLPEVLWVDFNYFIEPLYHPTDPDYNDPTRVYAPQLINAEAGWDITTGSPNVLVAVVDTGLAMGHPEFAGRIVAGHDFVNEDAEASDDHGHGTHVAGILAAAIDNGHGSVGIAPEVRIMPVKVINASGSGLWSDIAQGIVYAADHGAQIINLSLGGPVASQVLSDAVRYAAERGAFLVAAAGNAASSSPFYPAAYPEVLAVSGTTDANEVWAASNYGGYVDVSAPAYAIWSAYWTATQPITYTALSGTSMATPHVSGLVALLLSIRPDLTAADLRALIQQTALDLGPAGPDPYFGHGRIDVGAGVAAGQAWGHASPTPSLTPTPTATPSPTVTPTRTATATPTTTPYVRRVNASGAAYTDTAGQVWTADQPYTTGGWGYTAGSAKSYTTAVAGTNDDPLYQKYREGMSHYSFTVPNGAYRVTLRFAEFAANKSGDRKMKITVEGVVVESALDVYAVAGKATALDRFYTTTVTDGVLTISFAQAGGRKAPMVSALEVASGSAPPPPPSSTPTPTPTATPYQQRVNAGGDAYVDAQGQVWAADRRYDSRQAPTWGHAAVGSFESSAVVVGGTTDTLLYQAWSEGDRMQYLFDAPNGTYQVILRFAEFVATQPAQRVMRISLEDVEVESRFDVYALVGVAQALDRVYTTTVADGQVKVMFEATENSGLDPMVAAVAVKLVGLPSTATPTPTATVTPTAQPPTGTPTPTTQPAAYTQRVNAGGATYTDGRGQVWAADKSYAAGSWGYTGGGGGKSSTTAVVGTSDDLLYQKYREGLSRYDFTVPNGVYQVTLKFAEFAASTNGDRKMQIVIEGAVVESALDVYATAGKAVALDRIYTTNVGDGLLTIAFAQNGGRYRPMVSAIEVRR